MAAETEHVARIRINLSSGELEIEGREDFVSQYADSIGELVGKLKSEGVAVRVGGGGPGASSASASAATDTSPIEEAQPFGEILHSLASKSGTDQILLAGYYASVASADGTFSTNEANKLLIEQGIKLSNASQSLKNNLASKRVFKVGSRYRVAKIGMEYLKTVGVSA